MYERDDMECNTLMPHLRVEELARNKDKKPEPTKKEHMVEAKPNGRFLP